MFDKVYTKDNSENLRIFDDIEHKKHFSNYSIELNRVFGDKSYDTFYKNLIEHKRARCINYISMFQKPKNKTGMKIYEEPFNLVSFEEALNNMKKKSDKIKYKVKNPYISRPPLKCITNEKTEKLLKNLKKKIYGDKYKKSINLQQKNSNIYLPDVPDVGRYNPSFSILRKHTYQACFSTSDFHEFNKNCSKSNDRNLFSKVNDIEYSSDDTNINTHKIKSIFINTNNINNMSKTVNERINKHKNSYFNKKKDLYTSTSPLFKSKNYNINNLNNLNKDNLNDLNNSSNNMSDSQILIRTNGDMHSRCQKKVNNLYNTSSNFSYDDSKLNNSGYYSNSNVNNINLKNNHCLRFDNYSKRKPINNKLNYTSEHFTNANAFNINYPVRNQNACIEFNKLSTGKEKQKCFFEVEAKKNNNPPLGAYNPKFETTFGRVTTNFYMNRKNLPVTKKKKLKKIMFNYDVPSKYLLFQSLNNKK